MNNQELFKFISDSPTAFHVIDTIIRELKAAGFEELIESNSMKIIKGGKYFVTRNGSSLIAFKVGNKLSMPSFHIVASHSDSPTFKVKPLANLVNDQYQKLSVEGYGMMLCSTWFDRPLSLAGRVYYQTADGIERQNIKFEDDLLLIPSVAVHLNRTANEGIKYNFNVDVPPLIGSGDNRLPLESLLATKLNIDIDSILSHDLFLFNRQNGVNWGMNKEFISAPRLDDLQCAYASLKAFIDIENDELINIYCCFDNEEIGSKTRQGADSTFLNDLINNIANNLKFYVSEALARSYLVSADNAHAVHPNHPELSDGLNKVYMNKGIVIKFNASQSYTSDGMSIAIFKQICSNANVPYQLYANRSDLRGGGTLGNIATSHLNLISIDIGCPQLAMHSAFETTGASDTEAMIKVLKEFYSSTIKYGSNRKIVIN